MGKVTSGYVGNTHIGVAPEMRNRGIGGPKNGHVSTKISNKTYLCVVMIHQKMKFNESGRTLEYRVFFSIHSTTFLQDQELHTKEKVTN